MRKITIPSPDTIHVKTGTYKMEGAATIAVTRSVSFYEFIADSILSDSQHMGKRLLDTKRNLKILAKFEDRRSGDQVYLETSDWSKMKAVCDEPTGGWNQFLAMQLMPFIEAITEAPEVEMVEANVA